MADLIALGFIQIGYKRYKPGDVLPQESPDVSVWIECGSAMWMEENPTKRTAARQAAAQAGMPGISTGGEAAENDLIGRIPITERRRRK